MESTTQELQTITFVAYQRGFLKNGMEHNIAVERTALVQDSNNLNQVYGGIFQALFNLQQTAHFTGSRVFRLNMPIYVRFTFKDSVIDTASFPAAFADKFKMSNKDKGRKAYARKVWAVTQLERIELEPVSYRVDTSELVPVRLLGASNEIKQLPDGRRTTGKRNKPKTKPAKTAKVKVAKA